MWVAIPLSCDFSIHYNLAGLTGAQETTTMRKADLLALALLTVAIAALCARAENFKPERIIALERAALDRWGNGDPHGYLETYAPDVTYFDPEQQGRVDGLGAMKELLVPITGKIKIDHYEMIGPKVQHRGDVAVLSYNLVSHAKRPNGELVIVRWNSTEVYGRIEGQWKIIHSHWSYTKPELKQANTE
jgi:ketosteroid isomerase-like protein